MSLAHIKSGTFRSRLLHDDKLAFNVLLIMTFPVFVVAALIGVLARQDKGNTLASHRWSVLARARASANSTIPYVFMG